MLTPDELGEKGESRFKELCADAQLVCNKADRDRTGWDFIVEYGFSGNSDTSLDKRNVPLSCHVQVKTIQTGTKSIRMKLNMAERLAKELKPAFVYVVVVDAALAVTDAYLIHVLDDRLGDILYRLRKQSVATPPVRQINKILVTLTPRTSERISPTGEALRRALQSACGENLYNYSVAKQLQLRRLGFEERAIRGTMRLRKRDSLELGDILLGLRTSVPVSKLEIFEKRFDIEIQQIGTSDAKISFEPKPTDVCRVIARSADGSPPVAVDTDLYYVPAALTGGAERIHLRGKFLKIDLFQDEHRIRASFEFDASTFSAPIETWMDYWRLLKVFSGVDGVIEIKPRKAQVPIFLPIRRQGQMLPRAAVDRWLAMTVALDLIFSNSGEDASHSYTCNEIASAEYQIAFLSALLRDPNQRFDFVVKADDELARILYAPLPAVICNRIQIGSLVLGYHLVAQISAENTEAGVRATVSRFNFRQARLIEASAAAFAAYEMNAKQVEKIDHLCRIELTAKFMPDEDLPSDDEHQHPSA